MKNHLSVLGLSIAICTFLVAQGNITHRVAPANNVSTFLQEKQDTGKKHKMHKKWKKAKDSTIRRDTASRPY